MRSLFFLLLALAGLAHASDAAFPVVIKVDAGQTVGEMTPIWAYFGYDEPNHTYMKDGRKLLSQIAGLSPVPVYIRAHHLLTTGDGRPALKWGSSNAYTEDVNGRPVYDWTVLDRIFDAYVERGMKPLVEVGFMPKALSVKPDPYQHGFSLEPLVRSIEGGWAYPPKDYQKWAELIHQWALHCVERYGQAEVESWLWECWNEPNIQFWRGTPEEYRKLYDYTADAVKRAAPNARFGGPHVAGRDTWEGTQFFRDFLEHALRGENSATGKTGAPLDFIAFHAKGRPQVVDGHVQMGIGHQLRVMDLHFRAINGFPEVRGKPVIIGESDPEGCAACSARVFPQNAYRNGTVYSSYTAASFARKYELADLRRINLAGAVTWAFEFEAQPWFDGFRSLATNGIEKPVLNVFRMFGLMGGRRVGVSSSGAIPLETILEQGIRKDPDVSALASLDGRKLSVLVWHYHDDDVPGPAASVRLDAAGLPESGSPALLVHYRVDHDHSNSYSAWKAMGSPQKVTPEQYARLEREAGLALFESPRYIIAPEGTARIEFELPRQGVSLIQLTW